MRLRTSLVVSLTLAIASVCAAQDAVQGILDTLKWREMGPWRGGRANAAVGVPSRPNEFYAGYCGGGVWKTTDAGVTWVNVSDGFFGTGAVASLAVSASNPDTIYAGTGEHAIRGNILHGDGVYRSDDAGKTWRHIGLKATQNVAKIRIHPTNPDIAWAAALGPIYGATPDRGVYKTTDGGKTWTKTLFVNDRSGAIDLTMAPQDPNTLYAATWESWRTPYSLNSGGPGSRIFKSVDGGATWKDISTSPGLPSGILGKVGISVSPVDPKRVYAILESKEGGVYRSEDAGATWKKYSASADIRQRPWYYTNIIADTKDLDTVYVLNVSYHKSTNGGTSFGASNAQHSDNHDLWIDPNDNKRMAIANDGGVSVTIDGGRTWSEQDLPTGQFYHVSTDNAFPYRILGAQQDNSTVRIASRTNGRGIVETDWTSTAGGESGYVSAKPNNPDIVVGGSYGGDLQWLDHRTGLSRAIDPWPDNPMGAGAAALTHRFQWTFPIVFSPHDPEALYVCSQFVLLTKDGGGSFAKISPDLTRNDKSRMGPSGGTITGDNTSVEYYGTVFSLAESPRRKGVIWAGSDDGLIHVTQDGGRSWQNVTPKAMPEWSLVSMIEASPHDPGTAYAAVDNHENNDFKPYLFKTTDYGKTWTNVVTGINSEFFLRSVREDPVRKGLLFAATEHGIYVSFDSGSRWRRMGGNIPTLSMHDLVIKDGDLVVASHGRGFWVLDDISPLRDMAGFTGNTTLFTPRPAVPVNWGGGAPADVNGAPNPPGGMGVWIFLSSDAKDVKLELLDSTGTVLTTTTPSTSAGLSRTSLSLPRYPGPRGFPGLRMWAGGPSTIKAPPGKYRLKLTVDGRTFETDAVWLKDPRTPATEADLVEQFEFSKKVAARVDEANRTIERIRALRTKVNEAIGTDAGLTSAAATLLKNMLEVEEAIFQTKAQSGQDFLNFPIRLNNKLSSLLGTVQSGSYGPTKQSYDVFADLSGQLQKELDKLKRSLDVDLKALNAALKAAGKAEIQP